MRNLVLPFAVLFGLATPLAAQAGVYSDDLSRCLVSHTQEADQIAMAQWIFGMMSVHPDVSAIARVDDAARTGTSKKMASIFQTLLTESCKEETAKAVKYEGAEALKNSFEVLGKIAMQTLMGNPKVAAESQAFMKYVDEAKLTAVVAPRKGESAATSAGDNP
ncbi:MAG TPA: hypothetical protein VLM17_08185 [Xanthomonadaceae bacterium]|nr:hypothetical protein [Xanthomonadaceae bacterium]